MAEDKKSFVGYNDWENTFNLLTDEEAGKLIKHFFAYVNDKDPILEDRLLQISFEPIKLQLKRDLKKYETVRKKRSESGKKGGLKSAESRQNVVNQANDIIACENEANQAVTDTVNVTVTDILLEKETKQNACANSEILDSDFSDNHPEEEKEKSSAKKEKENHELRDSEFFQSVCDFFSQTTDAQKMRVFGDMVRIRGQNESDDFEAQTTAYILYKTKSDEKIHNWSNYVSYWHTENWIDKLKKIEKSNGQSNNQAGKPSGGKSSGRAKILASGNITEFT